MALGQELKDFVGAFNTGYNMVKSKDDKAEQESRTALYKAQADKEANGDPIANAEAEARTKLINAQAAQVGKAAVPAPRDPYLDANIQSEIDARDAATAKANAPDPDVAGITGFAQSQAVPTGDAPQAAPAAPQAAPTPAPQAVPTAAPAPGPAQAAPEPPVYHSEHSADAVKAGATTALKNAGVDQSKSAVPTDASGPTRNFLKGAGAAPPSLVDAVNKIIDPSGTMPESERNLKSLTTVYDYYLSKGDTKKANDAAASLYQYYSKTSSQYAAFAQAAVQAGDLDTAAKAMMKSYAQVPNGQDLKIVKDPRSGGYAFSVTDADGKVTQQGIMSPDQMGSQIMKVSPGDFHALVLNAAGVKEAASPAPPSYTEVSKAHDDVSTAFEDAGIKPTDFTDPKDLPIAKSAASHIYTTDANRKNGVTPEDSVAVVQALTAVNPKNPEDLGTDPNHPGGKPFTATQTKSGDWDVAVANGPQVVIPDAAYKQLMTMRDRDAQAARAKLDDVNQRASTEATDAANVRSSFGAAVDAGKAAVKNAVTQPPAPAGAPLNQSRLPSIVPQRSTPGRSAVPLGP